MWCENLLLLKGDVEIIAEFVRAAGFCSGVKFEPTRLIPLPSDWRSLPRREVLSWIRDHVGTGRCRYVILTSHGDETLIRFDSEVSPPLAWTRTASRLYPALVFRHNFVPPTSHFVATVVFKEGEIVELKTGSSQRLRKYIEGVNRLYSPVYPQFTLPNWLLEKIS